MLGAMLTLAPAGPAHADFEFLAEWGAPGAGDLIVPFDVERDAAGNAYVTDVLNRGVHVYDAANNPVRKIGALGTGPGQFTFPTAVGLNLGNGDIYVAELGFLGGATTPNARIQRFDANGAFLGQFGSFGTAEGQFGFVRGVSVDPNGDVFVADTTHNRVQQFDAAGQFVRMWGRDVVPGGGAGFEECVAACKEGEPGTAEGEFDSPEDVAAVAFGIFVSDSDNNRIQRFNLAGGQVNFLGMGGKDVQPGGGGGYETCAAGCKAGVPGSGVGELDGPEGLDVSNALPGRVWISDGNGRIQRYNLGLTHETQFAGPGTGDGQLTSPQGLAEQGGQVLVVDTQLRRFQRFDGDTGAFASKSAEPSPATLIAPAGIGTGLGGVYVADARDRVARFDAAGGFLGAFGTTGQAPGQFRGPSGLEGDAGGNVYVADAGNDRIQRFDADGDAVGAWGSSGTASGQFDRPVDVAIAPDGSVFTVESSNHRVQKFTPIGGFLGTWGAEGDAEGAFDNPAAIATDAEGNVYVADSGNDRVQKFTGSGVFLAAWGSTGSGDGELDSPSGIAVDALGNVFVADRQNNRIVRFASDGTFLGRWGANGGDGTAGEGPGEFLLPDGVALDGQGDLFVNDFGNSRVQKFAGAAGAADPGAEPRLELRGRKRQRPGRMKVVVDCGDAPCTAELSGRAVARVRRDRAAGREPEAARRARFRLRPLTATLASGETRKVRLKLRRNRRSVRKLERLMARGAGAKVTVRARASNAAGADADRLRLKLKRRR